MTVRHAAAAVVAALVLLAERRCAADDPRKPWNIFDAFARTTATVTIQHSRFPMPQDGQPQDLAQARQLLALAINSAILNQRDRRTRREVSSFKIGITSTIWDTNILQEYQNLVELGVQGQISRGYNQHRAVSNGASVFLGCHYVLGASLEGIPEYGNLGYPCPHGAAIQLQAMTASQHSLNCVVFYYPVDFLTINPRLSVSINCMRSRFWRGLKAVLESPRHRRLIDPDSPRKISLNNIAADFTLAVSHQARAIPAAFRFRVVLVLPVYSFSDHPDRSFRQGLVKEWLSVSVGLAAAGGHFMVDHVHVPLKLDLNEPPGPETLVLYILAAFPEQGSCDPAMGTCRQCYPT